MNLQIFSCPTNQERIKLSLGYARLPAIVRELSLAPPPAETGLRQQRKSSLSFGQRNSLIINNFSLSYSISVTFHG